MLANHPNSKYVCAHVKAEDSARIVEILSEAEIAIEIRQNLPVVTRKIWSVGFWITGHLLPLLSN